MTGSTIFLNGVSGSGKSAIIKTLTDSFNRSILATISAVNYTKGTTSTNDKYTFGNLGSLP